MALLRVKGKRLASVRHKPAGSKSRLYRCQPTEKPPRQPRVVDQDNSLSFRNHEGYIANRSGFDNEGGA